MIMIQGDRFITPAEPREAAEHGLDGRASHVAIGSI